MQKSFDVLQSQDISETVTAIEWINSAGQQPTMLASNSRQTKLFKIVTKQVKKCESAKKKLVKGKGLAMPKTKVVSESKEGKHFYTYKTGNEAHIHSLTMCPDHENFINADDNIVNLWNIERPGKNPVYNLIDYERRKAVDDDEIITATKFSCTQNTFLYTTSKGHIRVCDLRESSNFQHRPSVEFNVMAAHAKRAGSQFDKFLMNVSDAKFVPGSDHLIASRDYIYTKLWDMRMGANSNSSHTGMIVDSVSSASPLFMAQVTDYLSSNLMNLLENDSLDDQFFLDVSPDGKRIATGAYNKSGHVMDLNCTANSSVCCKFDQTYGTPVGALKIYGKNKKLISNTAGSSSLGNRNHASSEKSLDLRKRVSLGAWKPQSSSENASQ